MSITARGVPPAATVPARRTVWVCRPLCSVMVARGVSPVGAPASRVGSRRACSAAALRNTLPGASRASRSAVWNARGMRAGAMAGTTSASTPTTRSGTRISAAGGSAGGAARAWAVSSSQGLARATCGCAATVPYRASGKGPCAARNSRSGWPLTERTACENSSSAEALITCTANPSATPSMTATTAARLRHGWWRSSCQEKVRSSASMTGLWRRWVGCAGFDAHQPRRCGCLNLRPAIRIFSPGAAQEAALCTLVFNRFVNPFQELHHEFSRSSRQPV